MGQPIQVRWASQDGSGFAQATVRNVDDLDAVLDELTYLGVESGVEYQADAWALPPRLHDPLLIQFIVGVDHGSLLWYFDGYADAAVDPSLLIDGGEFHYVGSSGRREVMDPIGSKVTPALVGQALTLFVLTGTRPDSLLWVPVPMD